MSFQSKDRDDIYQSAQTYGRNEGCLVDYCGPPFRFQDHLRLIQDTYSPTVSHDLISQSGLEALDLSDYVIDPSKFDAGQTLDLCASYDINQNADIPSSLTKQVPLPLETPMLKSDPADDLRLYLRDVQRTRSCDMVDQWLPLSPTRDKRDEGLVFPESTSRFRLLLYRELDRESISTSRGASVLVTDVQNMCPPAILDNFSPAMEPIVSDIVSEAVDLGQKVHDLTA